MFSERGMNIFASNYTSCSLSISMRDSRFVLRPPRPLCDRDLELTIFWVNVRFLVDCLSFYLYTRRGMSKCFMGNFLYLPQLAN